MNYSLELKTKVAELYVSGQASQGQLCQEYGLSCKKLVREWVKKYEAGELVESKPRKPKPKDYKEELKFALLENEFLKKKLVARDGESSIANLWSSSNPEVICRLRKDAGL